MMKKRKLGLKAVIFGVLIITMVAIAGYLTYAGKANIFADDTPQLSSLTYTFRSNSNQPILQGASLRASIKNSRDMGILADIDSSGRASLVFDPGRQNIVHEIILVANGCQLKLGDKLSPSATKHLNISLKFESSDICQDFSNLIVNINADNACKRTAMPFMIVLESGFNFSSYSAGGETRFDNIAKTTYQVWVKETNENRLARERDNIQCTFGGGQGTFQSVGSVRLPATLNFDYRYVGAWDPSKNGVSKQSVGLSVYDSSGNPIALAAAEEKKMFVEPTTIDLTRNSQMVAYAADGYTPIGQTDINGFLRVEMEQGNWEICVSKPGMTRFCNDVVINENTFNLILVPGGVAPPAITPTPPIDNPNAPGIHGGASIGAISAKRMNVTGFASLVGEGEKTSTGQWPERLTGIVYKDCMDTSTVQANCTGEMQQFDLTRTSTSYTLPSASYSSSSTAVIQYASVGEKHPKVCIRNPYNDHQICGNYSVSIFDTYATPTPIPSPSLSRTTVPSIAPTSSVTPINGALSRASRNIWSDGQLLGGVTLKVRDKNKRVINTSTSSGTGTTDIRFTYYQSRAPYHILVTKDGYQTKTSPLTFVSKDSYTNYFGNANVNTSKFGFEVSIKDTSNAAIPGATVLYQRKACTLGVCVWSNVTTRNTNSAGKVILTADRSTYRVRVSKTGFITKYKTLIYPTTMTSGWQPVTVQLSR